MLDFDQCQAAMNAMIAKCKEHSDWPPVVMAIVDDTGNLLSYARTDRAHLPITRNAIKKAYTAAVNGKTSEAYAEGMKARGWTVSDMGDPMLISVPGGIPVVNPKDGAVLGGIGVAGLPAGPGDDDLALVGLEAMNL